MSLNSHPSSDEIDEYDPQEKSTTKLPPLHSNNNKNVTNYAIKKDTFLTDVQVKLA